VNTCTGVTNQPKEMRLCHNKTTGTTKDQEYLKQIESLKPQNFPIQNLCHKLR